MHVTAGKKPARWLLVFVVLAMFAAACAGDDEAAPDDVGTDDPAAGAEDTDAAEDMTDAAEEMTDDPTEAAAPAEGGTILFGDEQEPTILNSFLLDGNSLVTTKVSTNVLPASYKIQPDFTLAPSLLTGEAEVGEDPFTVTYSIKDEAVWNDGTPVSADDFVFTYETIVNPDYAEQITSTSGYEDITEFEVVDDKTVTFTFAEPYAPYRLIFTEILPSHVLEGEDFLTVWNDGQIDPATGEGISAGPFVFNEWTKGQQISLVANEEYWDGDVAVDELVMRYVGDTTTLSQQFRGGEITMFDPQPQIELVETLDGIDTATYQTAAGPVWEHIDFNGLVPGLDQTFVRQAIALGIDRATIVESLIQPIQPEAETLQNLVYVNNQEEYEPHYDQWDYDPDAAVALLEENGCTRGEGDIFECDGTRLAFRIGTTGGNERRELTQQLIQDNLSQVGIEISIENDEGATFFERLDTPENCGGVCDFDIALFAWVGSPDPVGSANIWGCDRPQNWTAYCNEQATELMDTANQTIDEAERADLFNEADALMAEEVPILPLFQQPQFAAWDNSITGPEINPTNQTIFWNSGAWALTE
ncbi:MAG: ABC transporter family substrate-binding protein [Egibacteraceae bacterium]